MKTKYPNKKHYCSKCEQDYYRKDLKSCFRCPVCFCFVKNKSEQDIAMNKIAEGLGVEEEFSLLNLK